MSVIAVRGAPESEELAALLVVLGRLNSPGPVEQVGVSTWRTLRRSSLADHGSRPRSKGTT
jgi:hypothetical protein